MTIVENHYKLPLKSELALLIGRQSDLQAAHYQDKSEEKG